MSKIYFIDKKYFREAIQTFAFRKKVNWTEEGMSILSWKYRLVTETQDIDLNKIYNRYKVWDGNKLARIAGHRTITIGDIIVIGSNARIVIGGGFEIIPPIMWKKTIKE